MAYRVWQEGGREVGQTVFCARATSRRSSVWSIRSVWFIWLNCSPINQTNEINQKNQTNEIDQIDKIYGCRGKRRMSQFLRPSSTLDSVVHQLFDSPINRDKFQLPPQIESVRVENNSLAISTR